MHHEIDESWSELLNYSGDVIRQLGHAVTHDRREARWNNVAVNAECILIQQLGSDDGQITPITHTLSIMPEGDLSQLRTYRFSSEGPDSLVMSEDVLRAPQAAANDDDRYTQIAGIWLDLVQAPLTGKMDV